MEQLYRCVGYASCYGGKLGFNICGHSKPHKYKDCDYNLEKNECCCVPVSKFEMVILESNKEK